MDDSAAMPGPSITTRAVRAGFAVLAAALLCGCGVRGAPAPAPPVFGETDLPPGPPRPYARRDRGTYSAAFAATLGIMPAEPEEVDFPETLDEPDPDPDPFFR